MQDFPETRDSLIARVQQDDGDAWDEFSKIYWPVIYRLARRKGRQHADAQDIAQQVLLKVAAALPSFRPDRSRAKFRTWLTTVCHNMLIDELRREHRDIAWEENSVEANGASAAGEMELTSDEFTLEHRRQVFRWAAAHAAKTFSESTWQAFWNTAVDGASVRAVANQLGISVGAVYTARSRVMQFLKRKVREYDDAEM